MMDRRDGRLLRDMLSQPLSHGPTDVSDDEGDRLTETYRLFLEVLGDGVTLTAAAFSPPAVVERFAVEAGVTAWWIGKANREDLTPPVASVRESARSLGLVTVRKGRLAPTAVGVRVRHDRQAPLQHIVGGFPSAPRTSIANPAGWQWSSPPAVHRPRTGAT